MKKRVSFSLSDETIELIDDLARLYGVSRSVILERAVHFIVEEGHEGELFKVKRRKKERKVEEKPRVVEEKKEEKAKEESKPFVLKM